MIKFEEEFIPYEEAQDLKQLEFDESCIAIYDKSILKSLGAIQRKNSTYPNVITAPIYSQAFRWFREKHGLFVQPDETIDHSGKWYNFRIFGSEPMQITLLCPSYEEAELDCLKKLIEIVKNENTNSTNS
jgi:hypothetical protein